MAFLGDGYADYIITGEWGKKAYETARPFGKINVPWDGADTNYNRLPVDFFTDRFAAYTHFTSNETVHGVQFPGDPEITGTWVADMSSDICSRPLDVTKYALIYAGAQKNLGPAGLTVVIARRDFLAGSSNTLPPYLDYRQHDKAGSLLHTPSCFAIYVTGLVIKRLQALGGLPAVDSVNRTKAEIIYNQLDGYFYRGHARPDARSLMNVTLHLPSEALTKRFVEESRAAGLDGLAGHRSVGGIRASLYNAMPTEGTRALAEFMTEFRRQHG
jgi:phosphoserine aminotransferase